VVLVPFPFPNLSASKLRPALVIAASGRGDWVCLQITSNPYADPVAIEVKDEDFQTGSLQRTSYIRPGKLFTAHDTLFRRAVGRLTDRK
jgi:mRNA interferase MazF